MGVYEQEKGDEESEESVQVHAKLVLLIIFFTKRNKNSVRKFLWCIFLTEV